MDEFFGFKLRHQVPHSHSKLNSTCKLGTGRSRYRHKRSTHFRVRLARKMARPFVFLGETKCITFLAIRSKPLARRMARRRALGLVTRIPRLRTGGEWVRVSSGSPR